MNLQGNVHSNWGFSLVQNFVGAKRIANPTPQSFIFLPPNGDPSTPSFWIYSQHDSDCLRIYVIDNVEREPRLRLIRVSHCSPSRLLPCGQSIRAAVDPAWSRGHQPPRESSVYSVTSGVTLAFDACAFFSFFGPSSAQLVFLICFYWVFQAG